MKMSIQTIIASASIVIYTSLIVYIGFNVGTLYYINGYMSSNNMHHDIILK